MMPQTTHAPRFGGLKNSAFENRFLPLRTTATTPPSDKKEPAMTIQPHPSAPAVPPDIQMLKRLHNPANWSVDQHGRPTIALTHHRVTLHRVQGGWTWTCERFDEPGVVRRGKVYPMIEIARTGVTDLWADLVDGGTAREDVYRRLAASAEKKWPKARVRPWPPERDDHGQA
jgi:hypothetical protein